MLVHSDTQHGECFTVRLMDSMTTLIGLKDTCPAVRKLAIWILFASCFFHTASLSSAGSDIRPLNLTAILLPASPAKDTVSSPLQGFDTKENKIEVMSLDHMTNTENDTALKFHIPSHINHQATQSTPVAEISTTSLSSVTIPDKQKKDIDMLKHLFNVTLTNLKSSEHGTSLNSNDSLIEPTTLFTTTSESLRTPPPTRKKIYVRGHLLQSKSRRFHPADPADKIDRDSDDGPIPQKHVGGLPKKDSNVECPPAAPDCDDDREESAINITHIGGRSSKRKRKHSIHQNIKYHNYKMLYDNMPSESNRQSTEFYAWIFGAAMLGIGTMAIMTSCFVYFLCSEKMKLRRANRRKWDKYGEYERVDSVSSIVDNCSMAPPELDNDQIDAVSII